MRIGTGELARELGVSEKAIRLYADRGLVAAERSANGAREFGPESCARVRQVVAMRRIELSLAEIAEVLAARDPVDRFDEVWGRRRTRFVDLVAAGETARDALLDAGSPGDASPPVSLDDCGAHLRLSLDVVAVLPELPTEIARATAELFASLADTGTELAGPPYVEYPERITNDRPGRAVVHVPVARMVAPTGRQSVTSRAACTEAVLELTASEAMDPRRIATAHDVLSRRRFAGDVRVVGSTREVYFPTFGDPDAVGAVMQVRMPVLPAAQIISPWQVA